MTLPTQRLPTHIALLIEEDKGTTAEEMMIETALHIRVTAEKEGGIIDKEEG